MNPINAYLNAGSGSATQALLAFDRALQDAKISDLNIVKVTSVLPPHCQVWSEHVPLDTILLPGQIVFSVLSKFTAEFRRNNPDEYRFIGACVSVAIPKDPKNVGMFFESSGFGGAAHHERLATDMAYDAMNDRNIRIERIETISSEIVLQGLDYGAVVASAILI